MRSIYFIFYKSKIYIYENLNGFINELKIFSNNNYSTYGVDVHDNVYLLPDERPYINGNNQPFDIVFREGKHHFLIAFYINELLKKVGKYDDFYIILENKMLCSEEITSILEHFFEKKFRGLYVISALLYGILLLLNKKIVIIDDGFCVGLGYKKSGFSSNIYNTFFSMSRTDIENIYYSCHFDNIYDDIPYELISNIIKGAVNNYLDEYDEDINVISRDRRIIIPSDFNNDLYVKYKLNDVFESLEEINIKKSEVYIVSSSKRFVDDILEKYNFEQREIVTKELFFEYFKTIIEINEVPAVKYSMKIKKKYPICYIRKEDNINNKNKYEQMLKKVIKKYLVL